MTANAWDTLCQKSTMSLKPFKTTIFTASEVSMMLKISGITEMVVADIDVDAILGPGLPESN